MWFFKKHFFVFWPVSTIGLNIQWNIQDLILAEHPHMMVEMFWRISKWKRHKDKKIQSYVKKEALRFLDLGLGFFAKLFRLIKCVETQKKIDGILNKWQSDHGVGGDLLVLSLGLSLFRLFVHLRLIFWLVVSR